MFNLKIKSTPNAVIGNLSLINVNVYDYKVLTAKNLHLSSNTGTFPNKIFASTFFFEQGSQ